LDQFPDAKSLPRRAKSLPMRAKSLPTTTVFFQLFIIFSFYNMNHSIPVFQAAYVLALEDNKYYIGLSHNINLSFGEHFAAVGPRWTRLYKPLGIIEVLLPANINDINTLLSKYTKLYGATNISYYKSQDDIPIQHEENLFVSTVKSISLPVKIVKPVKASEKLPVYFPVQSDQEIQDKSPEPIAVPIPETPPDYSKTYRDALTDAAKKTRLSNDAKGLSVNNLLTKENLEKWLTQEKRSYAFIAQHIVGCSNKEVAAIAKSFNLSTTFSAKRQMIVSRVK